MMTRTDDDRLRVWRGFLEAHASITERLDEELRAERGLPLTWYDVLVNLGEADGGRLRMRELADAVLFSRSGLTRLVERMQKAGLVAREACVDDARGTFAVLTTSGRRMLRRAAPIHLRGIDEEFSSRLSDGDVRALGVAIGKLLRAPDAT